VVGRTTLHSTIPGRRWKRNLRVVAIVSTVAVVAGLAALWVVRARKAEEPLPVGIPMQITSGEAWEGEPAISPDGTRIAYVSTASGNDDVYVTDAIAFVSDRTGTRSVWKVGQFGGGATMLLEDAEYPAISPDGTRIAFSRCVHGAELRIWVAPLEDLSDATMLTTGEHGLWDHVGAAWSPDGRTLSYSAHGDLWTVSADGGTPRQVMRSRAGATESAWSSDGRHIYFDSWRDGALALWRVSAVGGEAQRVTQGAGYESELSVSADGSRLAYSTGSPGSGAVLVDLDTGQQTNIGSMRRILLVSLSPDGSRMVFMSERWDRRGELAEQLLDNGVPAGPPRRLTDQEGYASHPAYSPDGRWIAYYLIHEGKRNIWIIPSGGGRPIQFTSGSEQDIHPAWSPDGTMLAFMSLRAGSHDLWVAPVWEGNPVGEPRRITDGSVLGVSPVWSPDGSEIAFVDTDGERREVWVVPSDGSGPASQLTDGVDATRIRWDTVTGTILASATCGEENRSLWAVSPETGAAVPFEPAVEFGTERAYGLFDLSQEGRLLVFSQENLTGDIWVSEGPPGTY